jgi:hypothetical protein
MILTVLSRTSAPSVIGQEATSPTTSIVPGSQTAMNRGSIWATASVPSRQTRTRSSNRVSGISAHMSPRNLSPTETMADLLEPELELDGPEELPPLDAPDNEADDEADNELELLDEEDELELLDDEELLLEDELLEDDELLLDEDELLLDEDELLDDDELLDELLLDELDDELDEEELDDDPQQLPNVSTSHHWLSKKNLA